MDSYRSIYDIRRIRLHQILRELPRGGQQELAAKAETEPSVISAAKSWKVPYNMGDDLARRIEAAAGKPPFWMDSLDVEGELAALLERVLEQIPPEALTPFSVKLAVRAASLALKEGWTGPTLQEKAQEFLRLAG